MTKQLAAFNAVLRSLAQTPSSRFRSQQRLCASLSHLGFDPTPSVLQLLASLRIHRLAPLHLDVARALAADPTLRNRVRGILLDELLVDILGFAHLRACFTRRFFTRWRRDPLPEENMWWAAWRIEQAMQQKLIPKLRLDSIWELLDAEDIAQQAFSHSDFAND